MKLTELSAWNQLREHFTSIRNMHLRELFAGDPRRAERYSIEALGLYFDYSKNRITDDTLRLLLDLAEQCGLRERIEAMFRGDKINATENRAVLHVALRAPKTEKIVVDGEDVVPEVHEVSTKCRPLPTAYEAGNGRVFGQARPQRHQYRDRGLRSGPRHGV